MQPALPLFPEGASNFAESVDVLFGFVLITCLFFAVLVTLLTIYAAFRYRRTSPNQVGADIHGNLVLEVGWTVIPLIISLGMFAWGAVVYVNYRTAPKDTLDIYVIGKQWMWRLEQPNGKREINELHVPTGRNVKMIMTSQDVIHSFFIPAFRIKQDVLPGRYTVAWFRATKPGTYHLFCAEYCGTMHSGMVGDVVVMEPKDYEAWMGGGGNQPLALTGEKLFSELGCVTCHRTDTQGRGPNLVGIFGKPVLLEDGRTITADENYIRESILQPAAKIVNGYKPIRPTFQGQISDEQLNALVAYVKSLSQQPSGPAKSVAAASPQP